MHKALLLQQDSKQKLNNKQPESHQQQQQEPCKYLTQTQTLQIGCQNEQQYSLRTKLCYPNQQQQQQNKNNDYGETVYEQSSDELHDDFKSTAYTQLESEINLVCLAHWRHEGNQIIVSRTMSNEILCSVNNYFKN
jgi:hypothetical protein